MRSRRDILGHSVHPIPVAAAFALLGAALSICATTNISWWIVAAGILGPDLTFVTALGDRPTAPGLMPRRPVPFYNTAHRPVIPIAALAVGVAMASPATTALALAWLSHIIWDRGIGYRLRDADGAIRPHPDGADQTENRRPPELIAH